MTSDTSSIAGTRVRIAQAQSDFIYDRLLLSVLMSMGVSLGFTVALRNFLPTNYLLFWFACIQAVALLRLGLWWLHGRIAPKRRKAAIWLPAFQVGVIAAALAWSIPAVALMKQLDHSADTIVLVALLAVSSVAVSSFAAHFPSICQFLLVCLAPPGLALISSHSPMDAIVGAALLAAIVALAWTGLQSNRAILQVLRTQIELADAVAETAAAKSVAERANAAKSRFLATMSHEIRTPLNGMLGVADILAHGELRAEQRQHVALLQRSGDHLLAIVNDVLDLSKIEAEELKLRPQLFDLREMLRDVADLWVPRMRDKGLEFQLVLGAELPQAVSCDVVRLRQILNNLCSNALKFTERGQVLLRVRCATCDVATTEVADIEFVLRDTGIGIPAGEISRIWNSFSQIDDSLTRMSGGTGLGLAICKRLVGLMAGDIAACSEPGVGSTFRLRIPVRVEQRPTLEAHATNGTTSVAVTRTLHGRVLVVEDNAVNQEITRAMLTCLGLECEMAASGDDALAISSERRFDLVLMDCQMPGIDGYEATAELRRRNTRCRSGQRLPIVALSANAFADDIERAFNAGMDAFVGKPVAIDALHDTLARWLPRAA